jgi:acetyl/propionyl-CoA carboxylase alpha subunit
MVAKLIVRGKSREECIFNAVNAVLETKLVGDCVFNLPALIQILTHDLFHSNQHFTTWLETLAPSPEPALEPQLRAIIRQQRAKAHRSGGFRNVQSAKGAGRLVLQELKEKGRLIRVQYSKETMHLVDDDVSASLVEAEVADPHIEVLTWKTTGDKTMLGVIVCGLEGRGRVVRYQKLDRLDWHKDSVYDPPNVLGEETAAGYIASMPATILKTLFANGEQVKKGEAILVMESMKMEIKILAHKDGKVSYFVSKGQQVKQGQKMVSVVSEQ